MVKLPSVVKVLGYEARKQQRGRYRVVEYRSQPDGSTRKRTIKKDLLLTDAENMVYQLEKKLH
jgi:hypothetical protein